MAYCREPRLFSQFLPRRKSLLSVRAGTKSPATISQDCLLGVGVQARKRINEHLFRAFLYTVCATSKTEHEPQGGDQSLKRHCGQGNRPMSFRGVKRRGNPLNRNKNRFKIATTALALAPTTAQRICTIISSTDKNSRHSFAKLSAW
mgnify:CR=1 FL=1